MFPAVNPLLGYLLYKAAKWLAGMGKKIKSCLKCFCAHIRCPQYKDTERVCVSVCGKGMRGKQISTVVQREGESEGGQERGGGSTM